MELLLSSGVTIGEVIARLERELSAAQADSRKLALHTAEQAKELGKLRDQLEEAQDKALRFDIDSVGIERREAEGAELVTLRAELSAAQARIAELEKENANQQHDIEMLLWSLRDEINGGKPCSET